MNRGLKLLIWTYIPTHHQSAFLQALRDDGVDLVVHYFKRVPPHRIRLGWTDPDRLPAGERTVAANLSSLDLCPDWRERIHVVPGYAATFLLRLALRLSYEHVSWVHWSEPSRQWSRWYATYPVKRLYASLINRYALGALAIGTMASSDFVRWGVRERLIRFLPYSSAELVSQQAGGAQPATSAPRFAFVGALCHRKGVDVLLRALHILLKGHPDARLQLVGYDESGGVYQRLVQQLGIASAVQFMGSVPADEIAASLKSCDVLVLPSRFDGWGMVLNEAASLGKALIASEACGSAHHLIMPGVNGYRVHPDDAEALAEAMRQYCRDPALAHTHGAQSREVFSSFTPVRNALRMRECLSSLQTLRLASGHAAA